MFCIINKQLTLSKIKTDETAYGGQKVDRLENDCVLLNNYKKSAGDQKSQNMIATIDGNLSGGSTAANNHKVYVCLEVTTIEHFSQLTSINDCTFKRVLQQTILIETCRLFAPLELISVSLHCSSSTDFNFFQVKSKQ